MLGKQQLTEKAVVFKKTCHFISVDDHLFVFENMKKEEACGIGCFLVAMLNSDNLRGLAAVSYTHLVRYLFCNEIDWKILALQTFSPPSIKGLLDSVQ